VGEPFDGQFVSVSPPRMLALGPPPVGFRVRSISPEFWRDELLFTRLEAELELRGGRAATTRINRPLWIGPATFLRLSNFGYAPRYELLDSRGRAIDSAFVKMNVFPPGQSDYFTIPGYPHRFYLEVLPDHDEADGRAVTRSLNLVDPAFVLRVIRGRFHLGGGVLHHDDGFEFEGLILRLAEIRYWGEFAVVRDPGAPIVFLAYAVGLVGLLSKLGGRRRDAEWRPGPDGKGGSIRGWGGTAPNTLAPSRGDD